MHPTLLSTRTISTGLILACIVAVSGCEKNTPPATEKEPAAPQTSTVPAPGGNMMSKIEVKGDEPLPPNHPPLPTATPPHPTDYDGKQPDLNQILAAEHPKPDSKKKLSIVVPDSVKGKWSSATLAVSIGGADKELKLAIGGNTSIGNNLQLHLIQYLPAYTSDFNSATSSSNEQINPAALIQIISGGKVTEEGWVFQNLPEFNSFKSDKVKVRLISAEPARK